MPVDLSIYDRIVQPDVGNALAAYGQVKQLQNANQQNKLLQMQMQNAQRENDQKQALNDAYGAATDPTTGRLDYSKLTAALAQKGVGSEIPGVQKSQMDARNAQLELAKNQISLVKNYATQIMGSPTLANASAALDALEKQYGVDVSIDRQQLATIGDNPDGIKNWAAWHAMDADKRLKTEFQDLGGSKVPVSIDTVTGKVVTGEPLAKTPTIAETEAQRHNRESEKNAAEANKIRTTAAASLGMKPPTESQGNAALFGARAKEANDVMNGLEGQYSRTGLSAKQAVGDIPIIGAAANAMTPEIAQRVDQAQRNFVNAVLRKESGASISSQEFENARKQYFPQPGDSDAVIAQKRANRETAIRGLSVMAGPAADQMNQGSPAQDLAIKFLGFE